MFIFRVSLCLHLLYVVFLCGRACLCQGCVCMHMCLRVCPCMFPGCFMSQQLCVLDPGRLFAFSIRLIQSRESSFLLSVSPRILSLPNEEDQKLLARRTRLHRIKLISFLVTTVYPTGQTQEQKALSLKNVERGRRK